MPNQNIEQLTNAFAYSRIQKPLGRSLTQIVFVLCNQTSNKIILNWKYEQ